MRIVIFHGRLTARTGGEVNTRDWALGLKAQGHRVIVFTVYPGPLAEQIRNAGIAVVDDPAMISDAPDIIFGAGVNDVATLLARFPDVPAVQVAQVWDHWNAHPCPLPQIVLHVAIDELNAEMLVNEFGVPRERVRIVRNAVDVARVPRDRAPLPPRPARALIFAKSESAYLAAVREACDSRGIATDVVGYATGRWVDDPLPLMSQYDLLIGSARTALEGAVAGAAVVVADHRGLAGMLTTANLERFRRGNFGREVLTRPIEIDDLGAEIDRYDPADAAEVSAMLRRDATLGRQVESLEAVFAEAIDLFKSAPPSAEQSRKALSAYLAAHLPRPAGGDAAPRHVRFPPNPWIDEKLAKIEQLLAAATERTTALDQQARATADHSSTMDQRLSVVAEQLAGVDGRLSATAGQVSAAEGGWAAMADRLSAVEAALGAMAERFSAVDQRVSAVTEHLSTTDQRLASTAEHLATTDRRLSSTAEHLSTIDQRVASTTEQLSAFDQRLSAVTEQVAASDRRLSAAADDLAALDQRSSVAADHIASIGRRMSLSEQRLSAAEGVVAAASERLADVHRSLAAVDQRFATMEGQITATDHRFSIAEEQISATDQRVATAQEQIATLGHRVSTTEGQITAIDARNLAVEARIAATDHRIAGMEGQLSAMDHRAAAASQQIAAIDQRVSTIEGHASALRPLMRLLRPVALVLGRLARGLRWLSVLPSPPHR